MVEHQAVPTPGLTAIWGTSTSDIWAVGGATVVHNDGTGWTVVATPPPLDPRTGLNGVWGVSSTDLWIVGTINQGGNFLNGATVHWDGTNWLSTANPAHSLTGVWVSPDGVAWAPGISNAMLQPPAVFTASGTTWTQQTLQAGTPMKVAGLARSVWVATYNYGIMKSDYIPGQGWSGSWASIGTGAPRYNVAVWPVSDQEAWSVGLSGTLSHLLGQRWSNVTGPGYDPPPDWLGISGTAPDDIWAVGSQGLAGVAMHWNGAAWHVVHVGPAGFLTGLWALGGEAWAVGGVSAVVHLACAPDDAPPTASATPAGGADRLEPNNSRAEGSVVTPGVVSTSADPLKVVDGDVDWFLLSLYAGHDVIVTVCSASSDVPYVELYSPTDTLVASSTMVQGCEQIFRARAVIDGEYALVVSPEPGAPAAGYALTIDVI